MHALRPPKGIILDLDSSVSPTHGEQENSVGTGITHAPGIIPYSCLINSAIRPFCANFSYQAGSWTKPRRVVAKVEWLVGELYPRVGFIVTNMARRAGNILAFYNKRGTCEQWIKEGKGAINWTRLSCRSFAANAVRLQLHAFAYNLGNFLRTLATPGPMKDCTLTTLKEKLTKIGAKVVAHARCVAFQMAEVAVSRTLFADILQMIGELRPPPVSTSA